MTKNIPDFLKKAIFSCIEKLSSSRLSLEKIIKNECIKNNFNAKYRKELSSILFFWVRNFWSIDSYLQHEAAGYSSLSSKDRKKISLNFALLALQQSDVLKIFEHYKDANINNTQVLFGEVFANNVSKDKQNNKNFNASLQKRAKIFLAIDEFFVDKFLAKKFISDITDVKFAPLGDNALELKKQVSLNKLDLSIKKHVWPMDLASQYVVSLIKAKNGQKILDYCSGKGIKTRLLANKTAEKKISITCLDNDERRMNFAKKFLQDFNNIEFAVADGTKNNLPTNYYDWILLDAPCSGSGTIRRHPSLLLNMSEKNISDLLLIQQNLLIEAFKKLVGGGVLLYITCSIFPKENKCQIEHFIKTNPSSYIIEPSKILNHCLYLRGKKINNMFIELYPNEFDTDGFFIAFIGKKY